MTFSMCVPFAIIVVMSFRTQHGFEFDTTLTLGNYAKAIRRPVYVEPLMRSLYISAACTLATILLSYPMAYYVAFHVRRLKMIWIAIFQGRGR
jgi:spermidine/putrescine transport system permease protein